VVVAAIGPITAGTAAEYGLATHVMPAEYTIPALARAIINHFRPRAPGRGTGDVPPGRGTGDAPPGRGVGASAGTVSRDSRRE
jgi:hypothetical protein